MSEVSERHEIRVRAGEQTIVFVADSTDGRLVIRQEPADGEGSSDVCSVTLADPEELRAFFTGLRRIVTSLGYGPTPPVAPRPHRQARSQSSALYRRPVRRGREAGGRLQR